MTVADIQLTSPRLRVVLGDDNVLNVQCTNADLVRFDMTRARHKWPTATDAPFLWLTFIAWAALKRTKGIPDSVTYEAFSESTQDITNLTDDGEGSPDAVDPTQSAAGLI
jgi:hypothetical protein